MQKLRAKRQVNDALNMRNSPNTLDIHELALNSDVLVWREPGAWKGPYKLVAMDGESCTLALPHGNTTFRATSVKPYLVPDVQIDGIAVKPAGEEPTSDELASKPGEELAPLPVKRGRGRPRKNPNIIVFLQEDD